MTATAWHFARESCGAALEPVDFGDVSNVELQDGQHLTSEIAKAGDGVAVPAGQLVVEIR